MISLMTDFTVLLLTYLFFYGLPWGVFIMVGVLIYTGCNKFRWKTRYSPRYDREYSNWHRFWIVSLVIWVVLGVPPMITLTQAIHEREFSEQGRAPTETVGYETRRFVLVAINPPKHMKVLLREVGSNWQDWVSVGKHCNNWRDNTIGDEYNITLANKKKGDKVWNEFVNIKEVFC